MACFSVASSVSFRDYSHEFLLIPAAGFADRDELKAMICEINDTHVAPEERLSYSLYGYDRKENKVEILC